MVKKRITVASAKAKGRNLQNWVAAKIAEICGVTSGHSDEDLIESRPMGQRGADVILRGETRRLFPYSIECKSGQTVSWLDAMRQAKANQAKDQVSWVVILKRKEFKVPVIMMDAEEFFRIYQKAMKNKENNENGEKR